MDLTNWLLSVVDLYNGTISAIASVPVLRFLLDTSIVFVVASALAWLMRKGKGGRL